MGFYTKCPSGFSDRKRGTFMHSILKKSMVLAAFIFLYYAVTGFTGCPFRYYFGISCPGCGMTRALLSAATLHFEQAFYYHPLFFLAPFLVLLLFFLDKIPMKKLMPILLLFGLVFFIVYIKRLLDPTNDIVYIDLSQGLIFQKMRDGFH